MHDQNPRFRWPTLAGTLVSAVRQPNGQFRVELRLHAPIITMDGPLMTVPVVLDALAAGAR